MQMIKLSCKSCGAKLELTEDVDRFSCGFCGNEFLVERKGGMVVLKDVHESLKRIEQTSEAACENTQVLADQVRLPKMKKKILELEQERDGIDLQPLMENPEYVVAVKKSEEIQGKGTVIAMLVMLASVAIVYFVNKISFDFRFMSIYYFLTAGGCIMFLGSMAIPGLYKDSCPKFPEPKVPDKKVEEENRKKWNLLDGEIRELKERVNKIENSF